jgi:hypothetical protein
MTLTHAERVELFLAILESNTGNISKTCDDIGMSRQTYYKWHMAEGDQYDILRQRIREIRRGWVDKLLDTAEARLAESVEMGEGQNVRFVLTKLGRERGYGDRLAIEPVRGIPGLSYPDQELDLEAFEQLTAGSVQSTE